MVGSPEDLARSLRDALANYYDPVRLQSHPLAEMLDLQRGPGETVAEALRRCLRDGIDRLRPPQGTPHGGPEWLGHRVLLLHYIRSLSTSEVCRELNISEATYYRRQREALQALASVLWNGHLAATAGAEEPTPLEQATPSAERGRAIALAARLPSQVVPLTALLDGVLQTITPLAEQRHVSLRVTIPPDLPCTYGDPAILRHAVLALLTGCICTAQGGAVALTVTPDVGRVVGRIDILGSRALAEACADEVRGLQMGMELLQVYGGEAWNDLGTGSGSVWFAVAALQPTTILIVDDDRATVELYMRYLEGPQYAVLRAHTAEEVEAVLERTQPDLILLDVLLPRRDGWLILEMLKARPSTAHIPVVVCSVIEQPELALALGAAKVLTKPITSEQLLQTVQEQTSLASSSATGRRAGRAGA
ncbi:MAG TPA: response regulator [Chloroflexi bacterium]|jgi:CheY-like chemotaxis protein|nr:response regulator [Chloroflexota bacterium]